jgi:hypothetical protein
MLDLRESRVLNIERCKQTCTKTHIHEGMTTPCRRSLLGLYPIRKEIGVGYPRVICVMFKMCSLALLGRFAKR